MKTSGHRWCQILQKILLILKSPSRFHRQVNCNCRSHEKLVTGRELITFRRGLRTFPGLSAVDDVSSVVAVLFNNKMWHRKLERHDGELGLGGSWSNDLGWSITSFRFLLTSVNSLVNKFTFNGTEWKR